MAHTRVVDKSARIIDQCSKGRYIRNVATANFLIAGARSNDSAPNRVMADVITSGSCKKSVFVAPSDAKIESIQIVGSPYPIHDATSSLTYLQLWKASSGTTDKPILSNTAAALGIQIGGMVIVADTSGSVPTWTSTNVAIDGTIYNSGQATLAAGDVVYVTVSAKAIFVSAFSMVTVGVEWVPTDKTYASS